MRFTVSNGEVLTRSFSTYAISADLNMGNAFSSQDSWGLGIYLLDDHLGSDMMQNQQVGVALAYHINPDFQGRHKLSFGVNADYTFSTVDFSSLIFERPVPGVFTKS